MKFHSLFMLTLAAVFVTDRAYATTSSSVKNRHLRQRVSPDSPVDATERALQLDDIRSESAGGAESVFPDMDPMPSEDDSERALEFISHRSVDNNDVKRDMVADVLFRLKTDAYDLQYDDPAFPPPTDENGQHQNDTPRQVGSAAEDSSGDPFQPDESGRELAYQAPFLPPVRPPTSRSNY
jgi:hypothetical protein